MVGGSGVDSSTITRWEREDRTISDFVARLVQILARIVPAPEVKPRRQH
jgi:hypothetical protein